MGTLGVHRGVHGLLRRSGLGNAHRGGDAGGGGGGATTTGCEGPASDGPMWQPDSAPSSSALLVRATPRYGGCPPPPLRLPARGASAADGPDGPPPMTAVARRDVRPPRRSNALPHGRARRSARRYGRAAARARLTAAGRGGRGRAGGGVADAASGGGGSLQGLMSRWWPSRSEYRCALAYLWLASLGKRVIISGTPTNTSDTVVHEAVFNGATVRRVQMMLEASNVRPGMRSVQLLKKGLAQKLPKGQHRRTTPYGNRCRILLIPEFCPGGQRLTCGPTLSTNQMRPWD